MNIEINTKPLVQETAKLVTKKNGQFSPIMKPEDIDRDHFFHLRSQLISLGCAKDEVVSVAKSICMELLQIHTEEEYLKFVYEDTFKKCKRKIQLGYDPEPIQDILNPEYSHTNLFSSIYGFEIEYLKSKGIRSGIADVGCGEGLFSILAKLNGVDAIGYEIKKSIFLHDTSINLIEDFYDIKSPFQSLIFNHVLEHVQLRPDYYLRLVIEHFKESYKNLPLDLIFISLPMHLNISSHLASNHYWVCSDEPFIDQEFNDSLINNGLKLFNPSIAFFEVANRYNYKLFINRKLGIYVFGKQDF